MSAPRDVTTKLWGELFLDDQGNAHFICHTKDDDFLATRVAFHKFIDLLQSQITVQQRCPFYVAEDALPRPSERGKK